MFSSFSGILTLAPKRHTTNKIIGKNPNQILKAYQKSADPQ